MRTTHLKKPLVAVAAMLLIASTAACTSGDDAESTPTLEPAPTGEVSDGGGSTTSSDPENESEEDAVAGECKVKDGDDALPNEAPAVAAWEDLGGVAVPTSKEYGPHIRGGAGGDLWTCYEHSPTGALFATFYVYAALGNVDEVVEAWVADSDTKDELLAEEGQTSGEQASGTLTPAAYRFISYSPDKAVIDAVMQYGGEEGQAYASMRFPLIWVDGAWKVDGENYVTGQPTPLDSLEGYVEWTPNG